MKRASDPAVIPAQRKAIQMLLVKDVGFDLEDILGERRVHRHIKPRRGALAWVLKRVQWLADPEGFDGLEPRVELHIEETEGMGDRAVWEYLILNSEDEKIKKKIRDRKAREAKRKARSGGN